MNDEIIEIRLYDKDHTKIFQYEAKIKNKRDVKALLNLLSQKGISFEMDKKDTDFF